MQSCDGAEKFTVNLQVFMTIATSAQSQRQPVAESCRYTMQTQLLSSNPFFSIFFAVQGGRKDQMKTLLTEITGQRDWKVNVMFSTVKTFVPTIRRSKLE